MYLCLAEGEVERRREFAVAVLVVEVALGHYLPAFGLDVCLIGFPPGPSIAVCGSLYLATSAGCLWRNCTIA